MKTLTQKSGYSAEVQLELLIGNDSFPLAQIGGGELVLERETSLPGTCGEVRAQIDENELRWAAHWEASDLPRKIVPATMIAKS